MNDLLNDTSDAAPTEAMPAARTRRHKPMKKATPRPAHYKVICISMYTRDIDDLDAKVAELKKRGYTKVSKSQLIRLALSQLSVDAITRNAHDREAG